MRPSFKAPIRFREQLRGEDLTALPDHALINVIRLPQTARTTPWALISRRFLYAILLIVIVAVLVWLDKDGYSEPLTFIDAVYHAGDANRPPSQHLGGHPDACRLPDAARRHHSVRPY